MSGINRHDVITLHDETNEVAFESFMTKELIPFFSKHYAGPTRVSRADLKHQSLAKNAGRELKYLWITTWDGSHETVRGKSFEHTRMITIEGTDAVLKTLDSFGSRAEGESV